MSEENKSALLRATQKLKSAKKQRNSQENISESSNKQVRNNEDDSDDSLVDNIINAVRRFKGD